MKANGAFSVKSYNQPRREQHQQINQAAHELGMLVVEEGGSTFNHNIPMIIDGVTSIEHNIPVAPLYDDVVNLWKQTDVRNTPTLVVTFGGAASLLGTVVSAFAIAQTQSITEFFLTGSMAKMITLSMIVLILMVRPQGLFASKVRR